MATKSTNSTIITLAIVGIGGYAAWKYFNRPTRQASSGAGAPASEFGGDNYAPYDPYAQQSQDPLTSLLSWLANKLTGGGGKSGGSGSGSSGSGNPGSMAKAGSSSTGGPVDFLNSLVEGLYPTSDGYGIMGAESNPSFGGDSLFNAPLSAGDTSLAGFTIPDQNASQTLDNLPSQDIPYSSGVDSQDTSGNAGLTFDSSILGSDVSMNGPVDASQQINPLMGVPAEDQGGGAGSLDSAGD